MTVMFADIRNFTGIAEQLSPPEVSELLNAFLTPMTRVIQRHRGTIDKYMGDAIMAFWGGSGPGPATCKKRFVISDRNARSAQPAANGV